MILGVITKDGPPFLTMYDAKKKRRQIAVEPSGPKVRLIDAEGHSLTAPPRWTPCPFFRGPALLYPARRIRCYV